MVDRIYLDTEKLTIYENKTVKRLDKSNRINDDLNNDKNKNFKEQLNKFKKKDTKVKVEKVDKNKETEEDIIVAESLNNLMNENRIISEVVKEKLLNNPEVREFIDKEEEVLNTIINKQGDKEKEKEKKLEEESQDK